MHNYRTKKFLSYLVIIIILMAGLIFLFRGTLVDHLFGSVGQLENEPNLASKQNQSEIDRFLDQDQANSLTKVIDYSSPNFNGTTLSTEQGGWQKLASRDLLGRPGEANALLTKSMMPPAQKDKPRERLTVKTPGYRVIKTADGYLYNRCHIIGYQLTGLNNEPRNLFTGTRQLNASYVGNPMNSMQFFEDEVAQYLKNHPDDYVRYRVKPIYQHLELVPRGVEMEAQSVKGKSIKFHVFIPNVQQGYQINYWTGYAGQQPTKKRHMPHT
ncbi:DNA/RNA non-specific endonuclease [Weissella minor]|uniref:DNA/RNA non-specific endonuclease n=1 Tax=Weissella minor TaxID=1620 RepID=UPI001BAF9935|nr:DNA/RNA non-specific endonuclease [Weissella minor]MBS0949246.1 DNA/RNA non-specific endonuclease [Weissella minor]